MAKGIQARSKRQSTVGRRVWWTEVEDDNGRGVAEVEEARGASEQASERDESTADGVGWFDCLFAADGTGTWAVSVMVGEVPNVTPNYDGSSGTVVGQDSGPRTPASGCAGGRPA